MQQHRGQQQQHYHNTHRAPSNQFYINHQSTSSNISPYFHSQTPICNTHHTVPYHNNANYQHQRLLTNQYRHSKQVSSYAVQQTARQLQLIAVQSAISSEQPSGQHQEDTTRAIQQCYCPVNPSLISNAPAHRARVASISGSMALRAPVVQVSPRPTSTSPFFNRSNNSLANATTGLQSNISDLFCTSPHPAMMLSSYSNNGLQVTPYQPLASNQQVIVSTDAQPAFGQYQYQPAPAGSLSPATSASSTSGCSSTGAQSHNQAHSPNTPAGSSMSPGDALSLGINLEQYISKRNERERSRVRNVNDAFNNLKKSLPVDTERTTKRMSKVEILRNAINYIKNLEEVLDNKQDSVQDHQQQPPPQVNRSSGLDHSNGHTKPESMSNHLMGFYTMSSNGEHSNHNPGEPPPSHHLPASWASFSPSTTSSTLNMTTSVTSQSPKYCGGANQCNYIGYTCCSDQPAHSQCFSSQSLSSRSHDSGANRTAETDCEMASAGEQLGDDWKNYYEEQNYDES